MVVRIDALSRRRSGQTQRLACGDLEMNLSQRSVNRAGQTLKLSPTSWRLLETLLRHSPNVVSREELEKSVWGDEPPDSNSLKVHLHNLRKVIDTPFSKPLIQTVSGHGFTIRVPE